MRGWAGGEKKGKKRDCVSITTSCYRKGKKKKSRGVLVIKAGRFGGRGEEPEVNLKFGSKTGKKR